MRTAITLLACMGVLAGCAAGPARVEANETLERYLAYAGEPVRQFNSFGLHGWTPLARDRLLLWTGVNEAWLITVWDTCRDLDFANAIKVTSTASSISSFETVRVGRDRCPIREIRPVDVRAMKAEKREGSR